jgi:hypothetical protein
LCGALIFGAILLMQLAVIIYQVRKNPVTRDGLFRIVQTSGNRAPCSFGRYIFINPSLYDEDTFRLILSHEKIHIQQGHSLDILLAELALVVQWFNPFAWYYRKALEDNLEFLTDAAIIHDPRTSLSQYQISLLRVSAPHLPLSITSNYNQSLLKKRMVMMKIQKSSVRTTWKYLFLLPLLTGMVCIFNDTAAVSQDAKLNRARVLALDGLAGMNRPPMPDQEPSSGGTAVPEPPSAYSGTPSKNKFSAGDTDILGPIKPSPVTEVHIITNVNPEVKLTAVANMDLVNYISPVTIAVPTVNVNLNLTQTDQRKGTWMATIRGDTVELTLRSEEGDGYRGYSTNTETIMKSEFSSLPKGQKSDFSVSRVGGSLSLNGMFVGDEGFGHYTFKENTDFQNYLV